MMLALVAMASVAVLAGCGMHTHEDMSEETLTTSGIHTDEMNTEVVENMTGELSDEEMVNGAMFVEETDMLTGEVAEVMTGELRVETLTE